MNLSSPVIYREPAVRTQRKRGRFFQQVAVFRERKQGIILTAGIDLRNARTNPVDKSTCAKGKKKGNPVTWNWPLIGVLEREEALRANGY